MKLETQASWRVACHGTASGKAVIIHSEADLVNFEQGDILIAKQTDMNYTPQMLIASAVITEDGGRYSHAAIFSRENNIPCIVGVTGIMSQISTGDTVLINTQSKEITAVGGG